MSDEFIFAGHSSLSWPAKESKMWRHVNALLEWVLNECQRAYHRNKLTNLWVSISNSNVRHTQHAHYYQTVRNCSKRVISETLYSNQHMARAQVWFFSRSRLGRLIAEDVDGPIKKAFSYSSEKQKKNVCAQLESTESIIHHRLDKKEVDSQSRKHSKKVISNFNTRVRSLVRNSAKMR